MIISEDLEILSKEFKSRNFDLYITGGFVRDSLLGLTPSDIDIASNMPYDDVCDVCKKLKFKVVPVNKNLGTLKIKTKENEYEYTRFRSESYQNGNHSPDKVIFIDDIETDCLRRDLSINAMYYKISDKAIIDHCHGQKDLENKIIRTANLPEITLKDDGLRILRTIRFSSLLGFSIEKKTMKALKKYLYKLKDISKERILQELKQIVVADIKYNFSNTCAMRLFNSLDIYPLLFNHSFSRIKKLNKKDISKFYTLSKDARLIGFYFLILKNYLINYNNHNQLKFAINTMLGRDGIKDSTDNICILEKLFLIFQNLEYNIDIVNASINYLTLSTTEREIIDCYISTKGNRILSDNISLIKSKNLPLGIHELDITASDLIEAKINNVFISRIMTTLFNQVIEMKVENKKKDLIKLAKDIHETFTHITKGEQNENNLLSPRTKRCQSQNKKKPR